MKVALLCSGLGHINRGHEVFARDLFALLRNEMDITLFKGGGEATARELVIPNLHRRASCLEHVHVNASDKWAASFREQEQSRIEGVTFAYAALRPLLEGEFDVIHCLEREVCEVIWAHRHLFRNTPRIVFSNGGAIPAIDLPPCDFVQEHTPYNHAQSAKRKAFMIPHGVDVTRFKPGISSTLRTELGIPDNARVAITVGTICYWHKRMDYVIREFASLEDWHLLVVGQESDDSKEIKALGQSLLGQRVHFLTLPHDELPQAYAAADVFVLGSLFETFGIVYIEAMAMGLPVVSTNHPNQQGIIKEGIFVDMSQAGALTAEMRKLNQDELLRLAQTGPKIVNKHYDLKQLKRRYLDEYTRIAKAPVSLPPYTLITRLRANLRNLLREAVRPLASWYYRR